jgi:signal transduction histidine kinase
VSALFAKILAWFVVAVLITVLATTFTSIVSYKRNASFHAPIALLVDLEAAEARHSWETGGRAALEETLGRFLAITKAYGVLFADASGTDLVTGKSDRELIDAARRHPIFPSIRRGGLMFSHFSTDGKYCFFLIMSPLRLLRSNLQPAHLAVVVIVVALCYALAFHLMSPLRSLERAVEKFGRGDLSVRAPERRRDELGDVARTFNQMAERLQTLLSAQHRLLLDISHELRSPLARLSVAVELARSVGSGAPPLDRIEKEADRLNELIGQMLEVARLESDPAHRRIEAVRLDELIGSLVDDCVIEAQVRGCALELEPSAAVSVEGDRELLRRAIENVMRNAIRYAPSESKVEVALENDGGRARVKVRDYGPGVPDAALGRIFDPFYRVESDRNRASGGSGLGLSIARRAVELHHGSLRASNAGPGLLVEIELPA